MEQIAKEYALLFNAITEAEADLQALRQKLMTVQLQAEAMFLERTENEHT